MDLGYLSFLRPLSQFGHVSTSSGALAGLVLPPVTSFWNLCASMGVPKVCTGTVRDLSKIAQILFQMFFADLSFLRPLSQFSHFGLSPGAHFGSLFGYIWHRRRVIGLYFELL